ncbi:MAG: hypothetical protein ABSA51_01795, partial [Anaerolineaceae bacterium]
MTVPCCRNTAVHGPSISRRKRNSLGQAGIPPFSSVSTLNGSRCPLQPSTKWSSSGQSIRCHIGS